MYCKDKNKTWQFSTRSYYSNYLELRDNRERRYENKNFTMLFQGILIRQAFVNLEKEYDKAL